MPIHLIIDGYNLLGVRGGLRGDVEAKREALIRDLAGYRQRKGHPVTVVFDGWRSGNPLERAQWREGLEVVYSRQGETADTVIKRLAERYGSDCAVVSSDHEIGNFARAHGSTVLTSGEYCKPIRSNKCATRFLEDGASIATDGYTAASSSSSFAC